MDRIFGTLNTRGDTETVLLGGAFLEHGLQELLEAKFPPVNADPELRKRVFDPMSGGILGAFAAKVHVARAMNLVGPETYIDLKIILGMRNTFAHSLHDLSFAHHVIAEDCRKLNVRKYLGVFYSKTLSQPEKDDPRRIFMWSLVGFVSAFKSSITNTASIIPLEY